jgi:PAS domain S-box-containing protein
MDDKKWLDKIPRKIFIFYIVISCFWIYISNLVLYYLVHDIEQLSRLATYKAWAYIFVTAVLLYLLMKRYISMINEREKNYQTLADSGQALVWLAGTDKLCNYFNKTWLEFTGRSLEQEMGNGWVEGVHPDDMQHCLDIYLSSFEKREKFSMEYRLRRHDGQYRWLQDDGSPRYDSAGTFVGYIGFCLDVTEGKQLEVELAKSNEFMSVILDCLSDGVVACDKDGRLSLFNRSSREFHGLSEQPFPPEKWAEQYDLYEKDGITPMRTEHIPLYRALQGHEVVNQEMVIVPKNAKPLTLLVTGRQLVNRGGEKLGAVVSLHDVTMVKAMEEHLRQSQKMDSIGALAGGVAHDFNNILTVIIGACSLLDVSPLDDPEQAALISRISSSADRASKLTKSLLAFSRKQSIFKQSDNLGSLVKAMQDFLVRIIGEDILLTTYLPDEALIVLIDRGQIEQVLMNLAVNARDAMPCGGVLNIAVSRVDNNELFPVLERCPPGGYALITVSDTGEGIDNAVQQRIFEPFFTTKATGKGSGLGLSMAYGIVRQHDGVIHVFSEPGVGTTFKIYLPLGNHHENMIAVSPGKQLPGGTETILLVEDDTEVLEINKGLLERAGYLVLGAKDGIEALELFNHGLDEISLVVLDVIMPGMNGKDVYEKLIECKNDVKVLFTSGYTAEVLNRNAVVQASMNFISKPLNPFEFLGRVRMLIDG